MKSGGGHLKGSRFERLVCKLLSLWVSDGSRDDLFWRSAMSGGRATIGLRSGKVRSAQAGDITGIDPMAARLLNHVSVECKSYEDLHLFRGIANDTGRLRGFWDDHKEKSGKFGKAPMLIARQNGIPTVCLIPGDVLMPLFNLSDHFVSATLPRWGCHVVLFEAFLREARVPELESVPINRGRVYLSA